MIYILLTAASIIIIFTNQISNINKKDRNNWLDDLLINNYKTFIGLSFLIFTLVFWKYSCFFISYNCQ